MTSPSAPPPDLPSAIARQALDAVWLEARPALVRFLAARTSSTATAEDLAQDVWLRIQALSDETVLEVRHPQAFIYRMAANLALDASKARRRSGARDLEWRRVNVADDAVLAVDSPSAEDAAWARQKLARVLNAIDGMPYKAAQAFRLHKFEGLSQGEVAERMGVSRSAVEKYVAATFRELMLKVGWP